MIKSKYFIFWIINMLVIGLPAKAQTFINTPFYSIGQTVHNDTLTVGPISMSNTNDNNVWALVTVDQDRIIKVIKYDSTGHELYNMQVTQSYTLSTMGTTEIMACPDNGCVFATNHYYTAPHLESIAYRLSQGGQALWMKTFDNIGGGPPQEILSIKPTYYNTTIIQFADTIIDVNSSGQIINSKAFNTSFQTIPDSDLIVYDVSSISRQKFNGNIVWSTARIGSPLYADSIYFYSNSLDTITKFRNIDGSIVWQRIIPFFSINFKKDGGYLTTGTSTFNYTNDICNYDSSGNIIWCKNKPFPLYGYRSIAECTNNSFLTGGATPCFSFDNPGFTRPTGAFICSLDSLGNGVIDSTDHFMSGNANDNSILGIVDDGPYITSAIGIVGIPRCLKNQVPLHAVFNTDWPTQFGAGINHKYSDTNGDGIISIDDLTIFQSYLPYPYSTSSHWRKTNFNHSYPEFKITVAEDSVLPGDTVTVYITLGDSSMQVDSVYSMAFSINSDYLFYNSTGRLIVPTSAFGDTLTDMEYYFTSFPTNDMADVILYRINHQNIHIAGDTITILRIPVLAGLLPKMYTINADVNAITKEGFPVSLSVISDSVHYFDPLLNMSMPASGNITISPNPAKDLIIIDSGNEIITGIVISDVTGLNLTEENIHTNNLKLNIAQFPPGCYQIQIKTTAGIQFKKFIKLSY